MYNYFSMNYTGIYEKILTPNLAMHLREKCLNTQLWFNINCQERQQRSKKVIRSLRMEIWFIALLKNVTELSNCEIKPMNMQQIEKKQTDLYIPFDN